MGCGCNKKAADFKQIVQQAKVNVPSAPVPAPISNNGKSRRQLRIEARGRRIVRRDARVKARIAAQLQQQNVVKP